MSNRFAAAVQTPAEPGRRPAAATRQGKKHVGAYVDPTIARQLRIIAAAEDSSVQQLVEEGIALRPAVPREVGGSPRREIHAGEAWHRPESTQLPEGVLPHHPGPENRSQAILTRRFSSGRPRTGRSDGRRGIQQHQEHGQQVSRAHKSGHQVAGFYARTTGGGVRACHSVFTAGPVGRRDRRGRIATAPSRCAAVERSAACLSGENRDR